MKPSAICIDLLGAERITAVLDELSSPQLKAILKEGHVRAKVPGGYVSRQKKLRVWHDRVRVALSEENDDLASELLQQWLLNHRRELLVRLLDRLEIKHRQGETDESFLVTQPRDKIHDAAAWLVRTHDRAEVLTYLHYVAYQQHADVFDQWEPPAEESK